MSSFRLLYIFQGAAGEPSVALVVLRKIVVSVLCVAVYLGVASQYSLDVAKGSYFNCFLVIRIA